MDYHHPLSYDYDKPPLTAAAPAHYPPPAQPLTADAYYLHHHAAAPAPQAVAGANPEIRTLFISGLPDDVKAREIHNLFRRRPGFETCLLEYTGRGNQAVAFAIFSSHQSAVSAMLELNGTTFDPETMATLHIELARSNSRRRPRGDGAYDIIDRRAKVKTEEHESNDGNGGSDEPLGTENDNSSKKGSAAQSVGGKRKSDSTQAAENGQSEKSSTDDISPCSTLFIANISPDFTEEELKKILSECRGFQVLKMRWRGGKPVAFADFSDVETSTEAKEKLLGTSHGAADDEGLHLEYARSKMRKT